MKILQMAISDIVMVFGLHFGLLVLVLYSILGSHRMKRDMASVKRGEKSWNYFYLAYGILSVIIIQIISLSDFGKGCKVFIVFVDLGTLLYLAFFNSWFRNKIIGFIVKSQTKEEGG
ncbi:MAG: hypothetical protein J7M20_11490 [Deltaproteobacteria bacterium]|nr:hypothetical protein [Deltaproteobacteria bacterium]